MVGRTGGLSLVWWRTCCIKLALGLILGMSVSPGIVLIAMSIEVPEMRSFSGEWGEVINWADCQVGSGAFVNGG